MIATSSDFLSQALGIGALLGGMGYALGQFLSSRRRGVADALKTALDEVAAFSLRADRLESEMLKQAHEMAELRAENITLRSLVIGGEPLMKEMAKVRTDLEKFAKAEHEKTRALIEEIRGGR